MSKYHRPRPTNCQSLSVSEYRRLYIIWQNMMDRCYNEQVYCYHNYGGRGIKVCDEWHNDVNLFREWAISSGYSDGLTIDRIDNNGNYCPDNCTWITMQEQNNNRRNNVVITHDGVSMTIMDWSRLTGINRATIKKRINNGWSVKDALLKPVDISKSTKKSRSS